MIVHYLGWTYDVPENQNLNGRIFWKRNGNVALIPLKVEFQVAQALRSGATEVKL